MPSEHSSRQYELDLEAIRSKVLLMGGIVKNNFKMRLFVFAI
jgi:phosphate transport system protein